MDLSILQQETNASLLALLAEKQAVIDELSISHLGILSPAAIRRELRLTHGPVDIIALDFRKLHELNELLGYDVANDYFGRFVRFRQGLDGRQKDVRGQFGGDEIVMAVDRGCGFGLLNRLVNALDDLTNELPIETRDALRVRTGGLTDGFAAAIVLVSGSRQPLKDAERAIARCGELKKGAVTGNRATSGRPGTIVATLTTEPPPDDAPGIDCPDHGPSDQDECPDCLSCSDPLPRRWPYVHCAACVEGGATRAFTALSIVIDQKMFRCRACDGPHFVQSCPQIRAHLFAQGERAPSFDIGRELCWLRWAKFELFVSLLRNVTTAKRLDYYVRSYLAYVKANKPDTDVTAEQVLGQWQKLINGPVLERVV